MGLVRHHPPSIGVAVACNKGGLTRAGVDEFKSTPVPIYRASARGDAGALALCAFQMDNIHRNGPVLLSNHIFVFSSVPARFI